jgi:2-oxoglutarate dehydrogenase E2 component (dihydrolipoamide succinyltransferase)
MINASVDVTISSIGYFDIGIAMGSPRGRLLPICNADPDEFAEIEEKIAEYGQKAQDS